MAADRIQSQMAQGAAWMVLFRLIERSIGLVSTLILARLLSPDDFGIVAMALSFLFLAEQLTAFGFDLALIQNQQATREHFDSAWTCSLLMGLTIAVVMVIAAVPIASFYQKPDVAWVVLALALHPVFNGLGNIGVVVFRKELDFRKEFWFQVTRKALGFLIVVPAAFILRNHWALVIGMLSAQVMSITVSYLMHPFRPRLDLSRARELFNFSRWMLLNNLVGFFKERTTDFFVGRWFGAAPLGTYNVAVEFAHLPSTELSMPINRALIPGFAKMEDQALVANAYGNALGLMAALAIPCAAGLAALAPFFVPTVLGAKWLATIPLIQVMALNGAILMFHSPTVSVLVARGYPKVALLCNAIYMTLLVSMMMLLWALHANTSLQSVAFAAVLTSTLSTPAYLYFLKRTLRISPLVFFRAIWRPVLASALMAFGLLAMLPASSVGLGALATGLWLLGGVALGALLYLVALAVLWHLSGKPAGPEAMALEKLTQRFPALVKHQAQ